MQLIPLQITQDFLNQLPIHILIGTTIAFFICALAIFWVGRKKEFLWYAGYLLCVIVFLSFKGHLMYRFIYGDVRMLGPHMLHDTAQIGMNLCYLLFSIAFLSTKEMYPRFHKLLLVFVYLIVGFLILINICWLLGYPHENQIKLLNIQRIVLSLFVLFSVFYLLRYGKDNLVYIVIFASLLYTSGAVASWLTGNFHLMVYGIGLENFVFSFGLGYKIKMLNDEKIEAERESARNEISSLRAQMNPHFIFNSLNSIQGFILKDKKKESVKYLTSFSSLLRKILDTSESGTISLQEEIAMLQRYLELESLRFDGSFTYSFKIDPSLDIYNIEIPILIIQPYIENAIIHGLVPKEKGLKEMKITFDNTKEYISCTVCDSGIGREAAAQLKTAKDIYQKSKGMSITQKRLELINKRKGEMNTYVTVTDLQFEDGQPKGTEVNIRIYKN